MWFNVWKYPKFVDEYNSYDNWEDEFKHAGFKTYRDDYSRSYNHNWLDDYEYTWFVLRYS